jgi:xanthine dehydrogenase accessory factor
MIRSFWLYSFSPSFIIIVTYSHDVDEKVLEALLNLEDDQQNWFYLGMIGSKRKVREIFQNLKDRGIRESLLENVKAPIGVPIGSHTPMEIAISIIAEIIKLKNMRDS